MSTRAIPARTPPPQLRNTAFGWRWSNTPLAKRGFVLLPRRWVVERSFAWAARFRRLARDYERLDTSLKGFHYLSFACIMLTRMFHALNATS